jgi:NTP pyrophosphatase (non-canonical NTP hydrolase)
MKRVNNVPDMTHTLEAKTWRDAFGLATPDPSIDTLELQEVLLREEMAELEEAIMDEAGTIAPTSAQFEHILKELADVVFVAYQYAAVRGWNLDLALTRVFESNMSKLDIDGKPIKDENGKVMKGPGYFEPQLADLIP